MQGKPFQRRNMTPSLPIEKAFNILLVEDNPVDVDLAKRAFGKSSLPVSFQVARDGEEALAFINKWDTGHSLPVFILLDLKLPRVDGLQVLREIKSHPKYRAIPIIVLTSSSEERDVQSAYELGVNSYIVKEIDFDKFMKIAGEIENYWCLLNVTPR
jgi:CheY-like chemotaxis protein